MEYSSNDSIPYFKECASIVDAEGYVLVELHIVPQKHSTKIEAVIASKNPTKDIGVADCSKAHKAMQPKLIAMLNKSEDEVYMEVCSPGLERNIKNAAEFAYFVGREVRVWDKTIGDWVSGIIKSSDNSQVTLETKENGDSSILYDNIAKAKFIHF